MKTIGIVGNGPKNMLPDLISFQREVDAWIGADRGALYLVENNIEIDIALGDFDSVTNQEKEYIHTNTKNFTTYPENKDQTDLEIAIQLAGDHQADRVLLFGVTGGRLDHELMNIQLLYQIIRNKKQAKIIDASNQIEMLEPGTYEITDEGYTYVSFISYTNKVSGLTLQGFQYPLTDQEIEWGPSLCISNKLTQKSGTFSFRAGILLLIKSCDTIQ